MFKYEAVNRAKSGRAEIGLLPLRKTHGGHSRSGGPYGAAHELVHVFVGNACFACILNWFTCAGGPEEREEGGQRG